MQIIIWKGKKPYCWCLVYFKDELRIMQTKLRETFQEQQKQQEKMRETIKQIEVRKSCRIILTVYKLWGLGRTADLLLLDSKTEARGDNQR